MKRLDGIYRGYVSYEKDNVWKIELEGKIHYPLLINIRC